MPRLVSVLGLVAAAALALSVTAAAAANGDMHITPRDLLCSRIVCGEAPDSFPAPPWRTRADAGLTAERIAALAAVHQAPASSAGGFVCRPSPIAEVVLVSADDPSTPDVIELGSVLQPTGRYYLFCEGPGGAVPQLFLTE